MSPGHSRTKAHRTHAAAQSGSSRGHSRRIDSTDELVSKDSLHNMINPQPYEMIFQNNCYCAFLLTQKKIGSATAGRTLRGSQTTANCQSRGGWDGRGCASNTRRGETAQRQPLLRYTIGGPREAVPRLSGPPSLNHCGPALTVLTHIHTIHSTASRTRRASSSSRSLHLFLHQNVAIICECCECGLSVELYANAIKPGRVHPNKTLSLSFYYNHLAVFNRYKNQKLPVTSRICST